MNKKNRLNDIINISEEEVNLIRNNLVKSPSKIQLLDYKDYIDIDENILRKISTDIEANEERIQKINLYKNVIESSKLMEHNLSLLRINPFTEFEKEPSLFFGMGGGSKALCKGLPFDVLSMILTAEKIRKKLNIKKCRILLANKITYTNIPRNKEFSVESIDKIMNAEKEILLLVLKKFNMENNWEVIMQTELEKYINPKLLKEYNDIVKNADETDFVGGHHYSIEMADIYSMVGTGSGGIKLGWFIRNVDTINGGYIMDEQPFHARYVMLMAKLGIKNKTSLAYVNAGAKLFPGPTGQLEKESPYICYKQSNRLLLSPFEKPIEKLKLATENGGGFQYKYYRQYISGIIDLFECLVLSKSSNKVNRIRIENPTESFKGYMLAYKVEFILNYIFECQEKNKYQEIWLTSFGIEE